VEVGCGGQVGSLALTRTSPFHSEQDGDVGSKPVTRVEALLEELCLRYGYCLPREKRDAILAELPVDAQAFVEAVLVAEGRDPSLVDEPHRKALAEVVEQWLSDSPTGKGSRSGLP